jgi:palmitoyltransferase
MEIIAVMLSLMLMAGASLYLLVCIDPNSKSPLGMMYRLVFNRVPVLFRKIFGNRIMDVLGGCVDYVFNTNHPLVQYFYILVAVGGYIVYSVYGFLGLFKNNPNVTYMHTLGGSALAMYSFYSYY